VPTRAAKASHWASERTKPGRSGFPDLPAARTHCVRKGTEKRWVGWQGKAATQDISNPIRRRIQMTRNTPFRNAAATVAATAPVLAMVAGLATAHVIASATGIIDESSAMGDHPRRAARVAMPIAEDALQTASFGTTDRRDARGNTSTSDANRVAGPISESSRARATMRQ
jgi:hypothetical protein